MLRYGRLSYFNGNSGGLVDYYLSSIVIIACFIIVLLIAIVLLVVNPRNHGKRKAREITWLWLAIVIASLIVGYISNYFR